MEEKGIKRGEKKKKRRREGRHEKKKCELAKVFYIYFINSI